MSHNDRPVDMILPGPLPEATVELVLEFANELRFRVGERVHAVGLADEAPIPDAPLLGTVVKIVAQEPRYVVELDIEQHRLQRRRWYGDALEVVDRADVEAVSELAEPRRLVVDFGPAIHQGVDRLCVICGRARNMRHDPDHPCGLCCRVS